MIAGMSVPEPTVAAASPGATATASSASWKRPCPQNQALVRRVGPERAKQILGEMVSWEAEVHVSVARTAAP
jgi:hypothetical protein